MRQTPNLSLKLPDLTDYVNIEDINGNMQVIDTELNKINNPTTGIEAKLTTHSAQNASKTQKGHMQVGDGLEVTNGVVSANFYYDTAKTLSNPITDYKNGTTITPVSSVVTNTLQNELTNLVNELMGWSVSSSSLRFVMKTTRRDLVSMTQSISVYSNYATQTGQEAITITRTADFNSPYNWYDWNISSHIIGSKGNPNGNYYGLKGWVFQDITNNKLYVKTSGTTSATNTGWVSTSEIALNDTIHAPGDTVIYSVQDEEGTSATTPTEVRSVKLNKKGIYRVKFSLNSTTSSVIPAGRLYVNGTAAGELKQNSSSANVSYTQDISVPKGGTLSLRVYNVSASSGFVTNGLFSISVEGDIG